MNDNHQTATIKLTESGYEELKAELNQLVNEELPRAIERVAEAREYGDLSENSEYHNAREDKDLIDKRISEIENILEKAEIVKKTRSKSEVGMGSQVTVHLKSKKSKKKTLQIVGEYESDLSEGKISSASPLGKALIGHKKSDEVTYKAPAGEITYIIEDIS